MSGATAIAGGLQLGSVLANAQAQNKMDAARQQALTTQQARQGALDTQIQAKNDDALAGYANVGASTGGQQANLASLYGSNVAGTSGSTAPSVMPQTNSGAAQASAGAAMAAKGAYGAQQGNALAAMQAPGMAMQQAGFQRARDASAVAQLDNFKSGTAATLPAQLDAANQQGAGLKTFADLLRGGAQIGFGAGAPGTSAFLNSAGASVPALPGALGQMAFPFAIP